MSWLTDLANTSNIYENNSYAVNYETEGTAFVTTLKQNDIEVARVTYPNMPDMSGGSRYIGWKGIGDTIVAWCQISRSVTGYTQGNPTNIVIMIRYSISTNTFIYEAININMNDYDDNWMAEAGHDLTFSYVSDTPVEEGTSATMLWGMDSGIAYNIGFAGSESITLPISNFVTETTALYPPIMVNYPGSDVSKIDVSQGIKSGTGYMIGCFTGTEPFVPSVNNIDISNFVAFNKTGEKTYTLNMMPLIDEANVTENSIPVYWLVGNLQCDATFQIVDEQLRFDYTSTGFYYTAKTIFEFNDTLELLYLFEIMFYYLTPDPKSYLPATLDKVPNGIQIMNGYVEDPEGDFITSETVVGSVDGVDITYRPKWAQLFVNKQAIPFYRYDADLGEWVRIDDCILWKE